MAWRPEVLHLHSESDTICGAKSRSWPEECMADSFARTLPVCEECKAVYKEGFGRDFRQAASPTESEEQAGGLFLVDFRQPNIKEHRRTSERDD